MTCKEIAKLLSEQQDHKLPMSRRIMIRLHLAMCIFCRRLAKHLQFIHRLSEAVGDTATDSLIAVGDVVPAALSSEAKTRIKKTLTQRNI
ncbi:MAG: zf-HC2 domain-containing protein [Candidatus Latescibacterota bacterium]|nr:MAG: zf-HC2 domain-containing protein [Candidatus Latescibacterota bacterium]